MFFPRLRRQAKWMFVLLALVFGVGFIAFGVGSNLPSGGVLGDIFNLGTAGTAGDDPTVSEAREHIRENPRDPQGYRDLGRALQLDNKPDEAIAPLERYVRMRPKDRDALSELASLYVQRTETLQADAQVAQLQAQIAGVETSFGGQLRIGNGQTIPPDPITTALTAEVNVEVSRTYEAVQGSATKAVRAYKRLANAAPDDASVQVQLAQAAEVAGDVPSALAAYRRFLKLAPDDPSAPLVKQRVKELRQFAARSQS